MSLTVDSGLNWQAELHIDLILKVFYTRLKKTLIYHSQTRRSDRLIIIHTSGI